MAYYGVHIPPEKKLSATEDDSPNIFENRADAFQMLKKHRESRLKIFKTIDEAKYFSIHGRESAELATASNVNGASLNAADVEGVDKVVESNAIGLNSPALKTSSPLIGEKVSNFRGPTSQELVKFRKNIEQGNYDVVSSTVWSNPRYFISSGDTPTILKESFRYNALHVAALAKNAKMCSLILEIVGDVKFIQLFYGKDNARTAEEVSPILLDLYLNMPEKGRSETPLHLAVKFGAIEVVEVLTSYKECQMNANTDGLLPKDMICSRLDTASSETVDRIRKLLQERFYVPVIRSVDNSMPPIIGEPFSPTQSIMTIIDPLSPDMEIKAIAGPMNKDQAETFRKRWKTPPRGSPNHQNVNSSPLSSYPNSVVRTRITPCKTTETDKTPRRLFEIDSASSLPGKMDGSGDAEPHDFASPIPSRFQFSSAKKNLFSNYRDRMLGDRLNDSLNDSVSSIQNSILNDSILDTPGFKERNLKLADVDKGLEVVGRCLAKAQNVGWKEFWSFLGEFVDIASADGLTKFEDYLQQQIDEKMKPPKSLPLLTEPYSSIIESSPMSSICRGINKVHLSRESNVLISPQVPSLSQTAPPSSPNAFHAYMCVEKSCQVFANRLLKPLAQQSSNLVVVNDALTCELGRLKSLVCSYKEDPRFFAIDFRAAHSRFAHILVSLLKESADINDNDHKCNADVENCLRQILQAKEKTLLAKTNNSSGQNDGNFSVQQLICLIQFILKRFGAKDELISPETLTTETDCFDVWAAEYKCDCEWTNQSVNNKTNRNIKRRQENNQKLNEMLLNGLHSSLVQYEDEQYWSLSDSSDDEDDEFYTPPSTPSHSFFDSIDSENNYKNYIFGEEPTKMDNDVLKALHNVEINEKVYPNVHRWYAALQHYPLEERESFPPSQWKRCNASPPTASSNDRTKLNCLFQSPVKEISPKFGQFQLKPSLLSSKF